MSEGEEIVGQPLDVALPGFLARPEGAPIYHGFQLLHDVSVDGFRLGAITEFGQRA